MDTLGCFQREKSMVASSISPQSAIFTAPDMVAPCSEIVKAPSMVPPLHPVAGLFPYAIPTVSWSPIRVPLSVPLIWIGRFTETVPVTDPPGWVLTCMVPVIVTPATVSEPE